MTKHLGATPAPEPKKSKEREWDILVRAGAAEEESPTEIEALEESKSLLELRLSKAEVLVNNTLTSLCLLPRSSICPEVLYLSRNQRARNPESVSWASGLT